MALLAFFIPIMSYVRDIERQISPDAKQVHDQLHALIQTAREQALIHEIAPERFDQALFPAVAWSDERLANLAPWQATHDWRPFMMQRKLFATTLAGVTFYEHLQAVPEEDSELREIFVLCLCMNFLGRYAQNPNDPALVKLRLDNYKLLRPQDTFLADVPSKHLFPEAYRVAESENSRRHQRSRGRRLWLIGVVLPLLGLITIVVFFNYDLSLKINVINGMLNS